MLLPKIKPYVSGRKPGKRDFSFLIIRVQRNRLFGEMTRSLTGDIQSRG